MRGYRRGPREVVARGSLERGIPLSLHEFLPHAPADALITAHAALGLDARLRSVRLTAEAVRPVVAA